MNVSHRRQVGDGSSETYQEKTENGNQGSKGIQTTGNYPIYFPQLTFFELIFGASSLEVNGIDFYGFT